MMRTLVRASILSGLLASLAVPASAQIVHSVNFGVGVFTPRAFDTRVADDVWVANLTQPEVLPGVSGSLDFDIKDFRSMPLFGEWNIAFGNHIEVALGVTHSNRRVESRYLDLVDSHGTGTTADDTEIMQDLRLRMIPITGVVRLLGGQAGGFQPYVGAGIAAVSFRYSEVGDFVDTTTFEVFADRYVATGTAFGTVLLGGFRVPLGGDIYALTLEGRYQWAAGNTGGWDAGFLADKIDLSGGGVNFGFLIRF